MSTAVEGAQAQDMIDEGNATTRYWDRVPIKMKGFEGEDELRDPTVRVLFGSPRQNADLKVRTASVMRWISTPRGIGRFWKVVLDLRCRDVGKVCGVD